MALPLTRMIAGSRAKPRNPHLALLQPLKSPRSRLEKTRKGFCEEGLSYIFLETFLSLFLCQVVAQFNAQELSLYKIFSTFLR